MANNFLQIYTGDGKGKTTAALGLALRCAGAGLKIFIIQFFKQKKYSEHKSLKLFSNITIRCFGCKEFVRNANIPQTLYKKIVNGWQLAKSIILHNPNKINVLILDEFSLAIFYQIIQISEVIDTLKNRDAKLEIIITGRKINKQLIDIADLVSEIKEIKHYYKKNIKARKGFEY